MRTENEALSINRDKKEVLVKNLQTGATYAEAYDDLVIATGSSPIRPPIPGIDNPKIRTLWTIPDVDHLREMAQKVKSAAVIGGGFIGRGDRRRRHLSRRRGGIQRQSVHLTEKTSLTNEDKP